MPTETLYRKKTIVVAEDEINIRSIVCDLLKMSDFDVLDAANGEEALSKIKTANEMGFPVDLLVTDIRMPVMSGLQLISELERSNIYVPVLVLSGYGDRELLIELMRKGCRDYVDKPFKLNDFLQRVNDVFKKEEDARQKVREYLDKIESDKALFTTDTKARVVHPSLATRIVHGFFTIDVNGELSDDVASAMRLIAEEALEKSNANFLINLTNAAYVSSYGMGVVIFLWKRALEQKGALYLLSGEARMRKKIEELNLQRVMKIFGSEAEFKAELDREGVIQLDGDKS